MQASTEPPQARTSGLGRSRSGRDDLQELRGHYLLGTKKPRQCTMDNLAVRRGYGFVAAPCERRRCRRDTRRYFCDTPLAIVKGVMRRVVVSLEETMLPSDVVLFGQVPTSTFPRCGFTDCPSSVGPL